MTEASDLVVYSGNRLITTSLKISHQFGKRHDNVLQSIRDTIRSVELDFALLNFKDCTYSNSNGQSLPMFELTRDAFALVAMSFTGDAAMKFKVRYIKAFNQMEAELLQQRLTDAGEAKELKKQLEACHKRMLHTDKSAQKIARLQGLPDLTRRERAQFANMTPDRFDRELAELRQCGLVDRAPINQRMLEMGKKGLAVQLAKKAAGVASMAKSLSKEEA